MIRKSLDLFENKMVVRNCDLRRVANELTREGYNIIGVGIESFGRSKIWYDRRLL